MSKGLIHIEPPEAKLEIERQMSASLLGLNSVVTLVDENDVKETLVFLGGLPLTYRKMMCLLSAILFRSDHRYGLRPKDDDGIARIWARVDLPESARKKLAVEQGEQSVLGLAEEAILGALEAFSDTTIERRNAKANAIVMSIIERLDESYRDSLAQPVRVKRLAPLLAPLIAPPRWAQPHLQDK